MHLLLEFAKMRKTIYTSGLGLAIGFVVFAGSGCQELNGAVDGILGRQSPVVSSAAHSKPYSVMPAQQRTTADQTPPSAPATPRRPRRPSRPGAPGAAQPVAVKDVPPGKQRAPGALAPETKAAEAERRSRGGIFIVERDPFKPPTEILPSDCPPSRPLCRFERSQLKLVGVMRIGNGQYKGMIEDPDGRGYFVVPGTQIGNATITQVTNKTVVLHDHRSREDVEIPLFTKTGGGSGGGEGNY